ncbi:MAG: DNA-binding response OmpR family regulator, partial [Candidatus Krumholzibacteriia bacterium]
LMTSGREYMLMSRALEAGIQHVMHKPVKIQELCRTLEELTLTIVA